MKNLLLTSFVAAAATFSAFATPETLNYQAVIKDANGVVKQSPVTLEFKFVDRYNNELFTQTVYTQTDANGFVSCQIGANNPLTGINWGSDVTLQVSADLGYGFQLITDNEVSSVPSALYALKSADTEELGDMLNQKVNEYDERFLSLSADVAQFNGFMEDADAFNERVSEELAKLQGLDAAEIDDFHQRVSDELYRLSEKDEEILNQLGDLLGFSDDELAALKQRVDEAIASLDEFQGDMNTFNQLVADEVLRIAVTKEEFKQLYDQVEAFATMNEQRIDKIQNQIDGLNETFATQEELTNVAFVANNTAADLEQFRAEVNENAVTQADMDNFAENIKMMLDAYATNDAVSDFADMVEYRFDNLETKLGNLSDDAATKEELHNVNFVATQAAEDLANLRAEIEENVVTKDDMENFQENIKNALDGYVTTEDLDQSMANFQENIKNELDVYATAEDVADMSTRIMDVVDRTQTNVGEIDNQLASLDETVKDNYDDLKGELERRDTTINNLVAQITALEDLVEQLQDAVNELKQAQGGEDGPYAPGPGEE